MNAQQAINQGWTEDRGTGNWHRAARCGEVRTAKIVVINGTVWAASAEEALLIDQRSDPSLGGRLQIDPAA